MKAQQKPQLEPRWWDALSALLLVCAILTAATRLVVTNWTEDLYLVQTLAFLGVVLGLALGQSRFSPRLATFLAILYGLALIPWQIGITIPGDVYWKERMLILYDRLSSTIHIITIGKPVNDNLLFILLMCCLFFILSVHAGYSLTRYANPWRSTVPTGLAVMVIHSYDPYILRRAWFLAAFLLFSLILVARLNFIHHRSYWRQIRTHLPPDIGFDWIRFTLAAVVIVTLLAWTAPALADSIPVAATVWQSVRKPWVDFQNKMSNAVANLHSSVGVVYDSYSNTLNLGQGSNLSNTPVLAITAPPRSAIGGRYYWQAYTYDNYQNGQWTSTLNNTQNINPDNFNLSYPMYQGRAEETFTIKPYSASVMLYAPAQPLWVSVPAKATDGIAPDGTADLIALQAQQVLNAGQSYQVKSSISSMTLAQLKQAGTDYPRWISDHYLEVPSSVTQRTKDLAKSLATGKSDPYDIAAAVTLYLRSYTYSAVIDAPPANQDMIDWWLFDYRKGFCQYYASAEVILLRTLGIPARLAVGYAQGEFHPTPGTRNIDPGTNNPIDNGGTFIVRERDAHAWPEVYFPGYGWVEFEPTASQSILDRPSGEPLNLSNSTSNEPLDPTVQNKKNIPSLDNSKEQAAALAAATQERIRLGLTYGGSLLVLGLLGFLAFKNRSRLQAGMLLLPIQAESGLQRFGIRPPAFLRRWARYARLTPLMRSYMEINRALSRLGKPPAIHFTPAERAGSLSSLLPQVAPQTASLLNEYQSTMYGRVPGDDQTAHQAASVIRKVSYLARLRSLFSRFQEPR